MTDQVKPVPVSKSEEVIATILKGAFSHLADQLAKGIHETMQLPVVDESQKLALTDEIEKAEQRLAQLKQQVASQEKELTSMSDALLGSIELATDNSTKPQGSVVISTMSEAKRAGLLLTTVHSSDLDQIRSSVDHRLNRLPLVREALFLRLRFEVVKSNLKQAVESLRNEASDPTRKAALIETTNRLRAELEEIENEVNRKVEWSLNSY